MVTKKVAEIPTTCFRQLRKKVSVVLLPLACTLGFVTLQTVYMHQKLYTTGNGKNWKSIIGQSESDRFLCVVVNGKDKVCF